MTDWPTHIPRSCPKGCSQRSNHNICDRCPVVVCRVEMDPHSPFYRLAKVPISLLSQNYLIRWGQYIQGKIPTPPIPGNPDRKNLDDAIALRDYLQRAKGDMPDEDARADFPLLTDALQALDQFVTTNRFPTSHRPGAMAVRNWLHNRPSLLDGVAGTA